MEIVAHNISRIRREKGITLRELARRVGVSASFLSQLEKGKTSPSLATLKSVATQLQTTISSLMGENQALTDNPVVRSMERKVLKGKGSKMEMYLLSNPNPTYQMEPLLFEMKNGATSGEAAYSHFGQEFVLVLKGALEINLGDEKHFLRQGDSIYYNSNTPHSFKNPGKGKTEALWVVTPPTF